MNLLIVILNYRTPKLTIDCLNSLKDKQSEIPGGFHAVIVENGSADHSARLIGDSISQNNWQSWATLMALPDNRGFAGGNNAALDLLQSQYKEVPYALLLNSDTIVHEGALRYCYELMQKEQQIGVMSCLLLNADKSLQNVTRDFPTPLRQAICSFGLPWTWPKRFAWADIYDVPDELLRTKRDVDWLGGAFMFLRATALKQIGGGLDHSFFFYGEDIEFCFRFHKHGWRVHYDPAVAITHIGGSSSDPTRVSGKLKSIYMWQARYQVQKKCYGSAAAGMVRLCDILALAMKKIKMFITGKRRSDPDRYKNVSDALSILLKPLRV
jgi:N-acetylglucosaminyl-diphospho-decaprenol L-rhamnosyltransferase